MNKNETLIAIALDEPGFDTPDIKRLDALMRSRHASWTKWGWDCAGFCRVGRGKSRGRLLGKVQVFSAYSWWSLRIFLRALFRRQPTLYYCIMLEGAPPIAAASLCRRIQFVFANMDNAPLIRNWSPPVRKCVEGLERFVARRAVAHVLPQEERWPERGANVHYVLNAPCNATFRAGQTIARERGYHRDGPLTVYVNGWLSNVRGFDTLARAIRACKSKVHVILAGQLACPEAEALADSPFCEYLGLLRHEEALAHYARAHLVFSYYDPSYAIDRLASSGKWAECILSGVPMIVNSEVETAEKFRKAGACFSTPYHDVDALRALLDDLAADPGQVARAAEHLKQFRVGFWDENMAAVLENCGLELHAAGVA